MCANSGGVDAWSWSTNGSDDSTAVPLLPPGRCNLPRHAATVMGLIEATQSWMWKSGDKEFGVSLELRPPPSVETVQMYLDKKRAANDGHTVLALSLEVPSCDPMHRFIYAEAPPKGNVVGVKSGGLYGPPEVVRQCHAALEGWACGRRCGSWDKVLCQVDSASL